jgi:hypothetical protein
MACRHGLTSWENSRRGLNFVNHGEEKIRKDCEINWIRLEGGLEVERRANTIDFDLFTIFESDGGGHEARAFYEVK